jgi:transmembrane sensor
MEYIPDEVVAPMTQPEHRSDDELLEQALRWHAATAQEDCDWQEFGAWLEASPRHRQAYADAALLEDRIVRHAAALRATTRPMSAPRHGARRWRGVAVAAGIALLALTAWFAVPAYRAGNPRSFTAQTGGSTALSLADGVQVVLAPGSALNVAGRHDSHLRLDGDAWFDVPHDPQRQLTITAGPYELRDVGTRFEVVSAGPLLKVAVAEGELGVMLPGNSGPVRVRAGHRLLVAGDPPIAEYGEVAAVDVAGWREGRLVFRNEPLSLVALQLGRHAGLTVTVDPSVAQRRFSGVFTIGDGAQLVAQLAQIMDLRTRSEGSVVHLLAADDRPAER